MKVVIGDDKKGFELKEKVKRYLEDGGYEVLDVTPEPTEDFVESSLKVTHKALDHDIKKTVMFDEYGAGSVVALNRVKDMVTADVGEERTGHTTAMHNEVKALAVGSGIVSEELAKPIINYYLHTEYTGGHHQVRLDMLGKII